MRKWFPLLILSAAQFVMVLDSSVMNVSISQIVDDLDTTIQGVQLAITMYTLVMAAFMLVGAKLGDIYGRDRIFAIGLAVYGLGSLTTALSPNLTVLLFGWSLVEGLGAVMVIPAIAALVVSNYEGKDRAFAYGMLGGVAGAAIAVGPLIGGWVTTEFSWRWVFAGEVVIVIVILLVRRRDEARAARRDAAEARLRRRGALGGRARDRRLLDPEDERVGLDPAARRADDQRARDHAVRLLRRPVPDRRRVRDPLGSSREWEGRRERRGEDVLLDRTLLRIVHMRAGLSTLLMQQLILMGTFFVLPVYLQVVLGFDAFETGKRLFPLSVALLLAALTGPRLAARLAPKRVCQAGLVALTIAAFFLVGTVDVELNDTGFAISLASSASARACCCRSSAT